MKKILFLIFLMVMISSPVNADKTTVHFNELGLVSQALDVYYHNGTYIQEIRSNGTLSLEANNSYQIILRPTRVNYIKNPAQFLHYINENTELILTLFFILVIVYVVVKK